METEMKLTTNHYSPENNKHFEGAMTQGNGYLNLRASFEEELAGEAQGERYWRLPANVTLEKIRNPVSKWGVYVPGIYGKHPILGEELVNLPYVPGINLYCQGEKFDMGCSGYDNYEKSLDMRNGALRRSLIWHTEAGAIKIRWERYLSMSRKNCIFQRVVFCAQEDMELTVENFLDGDVTTNGYDHVERLDAWHDGGLEMYLTLDSGQQAGMRSVMRIPGKTEPEYSKQGRRLAQTYCLSLKSREEVVVEKVGIIVTDLDGAGGTKQLRDRIREEEASLPDWESDFREHCRIWEHLWKQSDVEIDGDDSLQRHLRFGIYHLLRSANDSSRVAIDAKGYAGEAYFGHYFWDMEIYLLPFYIYTHPEQAKKLVSFRHRTLEGARKNAGRYGYAGARYPWEVCASGEEQCSNWQYADLEIHVTADVIYGMCTYCELTGDGRFLREEGLEMLLETARYWASRAEKAEDGWHLFGVMGPDEYLPFIEDNAYTNYMVSYSLGKTLEVLSAAEEETRSAFGVTEEECRLFDEIRRNLHIPYDRERQFIWQSADFERYGDVDFDRIWTDRSRPFGTFISQERNYRCKALKQADTVALLYLFRKEFSDEIKKNCIAYYENITTHDSSLSYIIHSLVYGDIGNLEASYAYAAKSMKIDWEGLGAAEGIHIANAGGLWQGVVCGFGGLMGIDAAGKPVVEPRLPQHITGIRYTVSLKGTRYRICVEKDRVQIKECEEDR